MEHHQTNDMEASGRAVRASKRTKQPSTRGRRSYKDSFDTPSSATVKTRLSSSNENAKRDRRSTSSTSRQMDTHCPPYGSLAPTPDMNNYYAMAERTRSSNTADLHRASPQYADQASSPSNVPDRPSSCRYNTRSSVAVHKLPLSAAPTMAHMPMNRADRPPVTTNGTGTQQMSSPAPVACPVTLHTDKQTKDQEGQTDLELDDSIIKFLKMLRSKKIDVDHLCQIIENNEYVTIICKDGDVEIQDDDDRTVSATTNNQIISVYEARKNEILANLLQNFHSNVAQMFISGNNNPALQYQSEQHKADCEDQNSASIINNDMQSGALNENPEISLMSAPNAHEIMNTNIDLNQEAMSSSMQSQVMQNSTSPQNISSNPNMTTDNQNMFNYNQTPNWYFNNVQTSSPMSRRNEHYFDNNYSQNWSHYAQNPNYSRNQYSQTRGQQAQNWQRGFRMPHNANNIRALAMAAAFCMRGGYR